MAQQPKPMGVMGIPKGTAGVVRNNYEAPEREPEQQSTIAPEHAIEVAPGRALKRPPIKGGVVGVNFRIPTEIHAELKLMSFETGESITSIIEAGVTAWLKKNGYARQA